MVYIILWNCSVIAVMTSAVDAATVAKKIRGSSIVECSANDYTQAGKQLISTNPSLNGFTY